MAKCFKFSAPGQSLIEVVVAVGATSLLLVALLSMMAVSLRNSRLAKDRARAVALAQEGMELIRAFRDYQWSQFSALADGSEYLLPKNWVVEDGLTQPCQNQREIYSFFWRCVSLGLTSPGQVAVAVEVGWNEGPQVFTTSQATEMSLWER